MAGQTGEVEHTSRILLEADPAAVVVVLRDLDTYPHWNDVVAEVEAEPASEGVWLTTLKARVGPFARSKQLRFARTEDSVTDGVHSIRFERTEQDERDHAEWTMHATVEPAEGGSLVLLGLAYSGGLWTGALDPVLGAAIDRATRRLPDYLAANSPE